MAQNLDRALSSVDPEVQTLFISAFSEVALDPKYLSVTDQPDHELLAVRFAADYAAIACIRLVSVRA